MIRALIFDFDGLILDTETPVIETWAAMHQEVGLIYPKENAREMVGHVDLPFDPWATFPTAADRIALNAEHKRRSRILLERQSIRPGVEEYLRIAEERGLRRAVACNSSHTWVDRHLSRLGIMENFDVIKCREDVVRGKPEPDVYLAVLQALQISGAEAIAFEDSEPGTSAAKSAGIWVIAVPNPSTQHCRFSDAHARVNSLADQPLETWMQRWAGKDEK